MVIEYSVTRCMWLQLSLLQLFKNHKKCLPRQLHTVRLSCAAPTKNICNNRDMKNSGTLCTTQEELSWARHPDDTVTLDWTEKLSQSNLLEDRQKPGVKQHSVPKLK